MITIKKIIETFSQIFKNKSNKEISNNLIDVESFSPYFKSFALDVAMNEGLSSYLSHIGTPLNADEYESLFKQLINKENFIDNKENFKVLSNIYEDVEIIYKKVKILENLGVNLTLDLTGGAVRDFVLGKGSQISDLDIMFSFNDEPENNDNDSTSILSVVTHKQLLNIGFNDKELSSIGWLDSEQDLNIRKTKLVQLCLLDKVSEVFSHTQSTRVLDKEDKGGSDPYLKIFQDRLCGVIKLKKQKNYCIDILITDLKKYEFIDDFDINLCKASIVFKSKHHEKEFPQKPEHLLSRFLANTTFFADIKNKKLTIDVSNKSLGMLDSILNKHLPKVTKKYSDYSLNLISSTLADSAKLNEIKAKILADKLNDNLTYKPKILSSKVKI